ncbi:MULTISPECIES: rhomboid family intramembrane serine protease [unclassified Wenzhouxiangella]|uniref:rhomboid family intramembrane serine protease n=1 Tax=unclassified Wenzhouxiangella TaxID=2613841 RepID=UPI000E32912B|nr:MULTISPECIES: rhomboid family intramembrane serine protease [unclassified Wenzhouxiangella]RFF27175.1 rhomboid family intramembrane serine protease [Wenzhouxiangella sp. 15181]RFP69138.1 rhomboid family intramembrane serine protease [Wenzhouxiangella sp. 15190]
MNQPFPFQRQSNPPVSMILLGITVVMYFVQMTAMSDVIRLFALWPLATPDLIRFGDGNTMATGFAPWQLVSYGFLHGGIGHLFFNMFALYMFGLPVERVWGARRFLVYYFVCMIGAAVIQLTVAAVTGEVYPTIGASGAVFGLLLAFGMMFPNSTIMLLIPPIPMKAKYFVIGYGLLTLFFGMTGTMAGVAHFAHLGGMLFGFGLILYWGSRRSRMR